MAKPIKVDIKDFEEDNLNIHVSQGNKKVIISGEPAEMATCCGMTEIGNLRVNKAVGTPRMSSDEKYKLARAGLKKVLLEGYERRDAEYFHRVGKLVCTDVAGGATGEAAKGLGFRTVGAPSVNPKTGRKVTLYEFGLTVKDVDGLSRQSRSGPKSKNVQCSYLGDGEEEIEVPRWNLQHVKYHRS